MEKGKTKGYKCDSLDNRSFSPIKDENKFIYKNIYQYKNNLSFFEEHKTNDFRKSFQKYQCSGNLLESNIKTNLLNQKQENENESENQKKESFDNIIKNLDFHHPLKMI